MTRVARDRFHFKKEKRRSQLGYFEMENGFINDPAGLKKLSEEDSSSFSHA